LTAAAEGVRSTNCSVPGRIHETESLRYMVFRMTRKDGDMLYRATCKDEMQG